VRGGERGEVNNNVDIIIVLVPPAPLKQQSNDIDGTGKAKDDNDGINNTVGGERE